MQQLLGRQFRLEQVEYTIVDVRKLNGEYMVVAEQRTQPAPRATFRASDIEPKLAPLVS